MVDMEFVERENEILKSLKRMVEAGIDFIVVGGYAVSALARHRFSVHCDVVIPKKKQDQFERVLEDEGLRKHMERTDFDRTYAGEFISYKKLVNKLPVTIDLLVGSLACRATDASWSFEYVDKHSAEAIIPGTESSVTCRIPQRELLIAFKIHSGRRTDVRDAVMLTENANSQKVLEHLKRGDIEALKNQVKNVISMLNDTRLVDSLKGVFTLTADVRKQIESTRKFVDNILLRLV